MSKKETLFETPFDTYTSTSVIGEGGAGRVFAVTNNAGEVFALKCMDPDRVSTEKLKRFKNEIEFCQRQSHRNVVTVIDTGATVINDVKCPFYVMPMYQGTMRTLMSMGIETTKVLPLFAQLLDGVEAAHLANVWHRDLKPENILWDSDESRLIVADFGIAHFEEEEIYTAVETKVAARMANFKYAAPEQKDRNLSVDRRADIYALGLILNEMFTGEVAQGSGYQRVSDIDDRYAYLDDLLDLMIQQVPSNRPASIHEIKEELIGRKNAFVALQQYNARKNEVIKTSEAPTFEQITVLGLDYKLGTITFELSSVPQPGWIQEFRQPRGGHQALLGHGPETFSFHGNRVSQSVRDDDKFIQQIIGHFKGYVQTANKNYELQLQENAKENDRRQRAELEKKIAQAELRKNILSKIQL